MRRLRFALAIAVAAALPASALGATVLGTARPDVVQGTARTDLVDVVGGGRDTVRCGGGVDTVMADASDRVARDCEVVARRIARDPVLGGTGAHSTIVEPAAASDGSSGIVAVYQAGRRREGADALGFATSHDGGRTWRSGLLPITGTGGGRWGVASDPVVAWDAAHSRWLAAGLAFDADSEALPVVASPDGIHWKPASPAVDVPVGGPKDVPIDKDWLACDARGTCTMAATTAPDTGAAQLSLWTTTDAGGSWKAGAQLPHGYFAQLAPLADGSLVVVYLDASRRVLVAARSLDGGASIVGSVDVADAGIQPKEAGVRAPSIPSVAVGHAGELEIAWPSCSDAFCGGVGVRLAHSADGGLTWSAASTIDAVHGFPVAPSLAADPVSGRLVLTVYVQPRESCCGLVAEVLSSRDDGASWTVRRASVRPLPASWLAPALGGAFVGDYVATVFSGRTAVSVLPLAVPPTGSRLSEDLYAVRS